MTGTKSLYAATLVLAGAAGFSSGWTVKPQEVRVVLSPVEQHMLQYERSYRLTPGEREKLQVLVQGYVDETGSLAHEFDRKYHDQVQAVLDKWDAKIKALLTPDKRR
jgi:hypothetical protein